MIRSRAIPRCLLLAGLLAAACPSPTPQEPDAGPVPPAPDAALPKDAAAPAADGGLDSGGPVEPGPDAGPDDAGSPDAARFEEVAAELPPYAGWSDGGVEPLSATVCPAGDAGCAPGLETQVRWTVNGAGFVSVALKVGVADEGYQARLVSGPGYEHWGFLVAAGTDALRLASATPNVTLLDYAVPAVWGGVTELPFVETGLKGPGGRSFLFRYAGFDPKVSHAELHASIEAIAAAETAIVGRPAVPFVAFVMPTEIALPLGHEGNVSFGNGTVGLNYGNPDWVAAMGGVARLIIWEFAHEYSHEHFVETGKAFLVNPTCLNEGLADAMGNHLGYVPDDDFCPDGDADGVCDYRSGCQAVTEYHAKGNCLLWQFKDAGLLTPAFLNGAFNPQRTGYAFDSCDLTNETTGNSYVVYFSEALGAGQDAAAQVTAAGVPNAGSYAAAKAALGW